MARPPIQLALLTLTILATGCSEDERLAEIARQSTQHQAEQNQEMARLNREVAESHKRLIEAEGQAREEVLQLQRTVVERDREGRRELAQLQRHLEKTATEERRHLDRQKEALDQERKEIAQQRHRAPILAATITSLGLTLACLLPLVLAIYLLRAVRSEDPPEEELTLLLTRELLAERPVFPSIEGNERARIEDGREELRQEDEEDRALPW